MRYEGADERMRKKGDRKTCSCAERREEREVACCKIRGRV